MSEVINQTRPGNPWMKFVVGTAIWAIVGGISGYLLATHFYPNFLIWKGALDKFSGTMSCFYCFLCKGVYLDVDSFLQGTVTPLL